MESKQLPRRGTLLQNECTHLEYELVENDVFIHLEVYKWSLSYYKLYKDIWAKFLARLKSEGVESVYCLVPSSDKKIIKFEKMFGFTEVTKVKEALLMECET